MLDELGVKLYERSVEAGFYDSLKMDEFNSQAKQLMMIVSEVVEVMEALRKSKGEQAVMDELADVQIRLSDFVEAIRRAGVISSSFDQAVHDKHEYNKTRPKMHGVKG